MERFCLMQFSANEKELKKIHTHLGTIDFLQFLERTELYVDKAGGEYLSEVAKNLYGTSQKKKDEKYEKNN